jgi:hypothetical protein
LCLFRVAKDPSVCPKASARDLSGRLNSDINTAPSLNIIGAPPDEV